MDERVDRTDTSVVRNAILERRRTQAIDTAIDRAIDGAAMMTLADRQLETMSSRIVTLFERELAEQGFEVVRVLEGKVHG